MQNSNIGFKTWGANVYISPHTKNSEGAVAPLPTPPTIDAYAYLPKIVFPKVV